MLLQIQEIQLTIAIGSTVFIFFLLIVVITIVKYKQRTYKYLLESEQLKTEFSETLLKSRLEIKEQTLQHLAVELHDNLGQIASIIKINLNTLKFDDTEKAKTKIEDTKELTRQLITDIKLLSASLNGNRITELGLVKGLELEVERLNRTGQFEASLCFDGQEIALEDNKAIILFRMAQEILNNAVKHSGAKRIEISINITGNLFTLAIVDNGMGFNLEEKVKSGGSGLLNLQSRAKLIQAQVSVQSSVGNGTKISIELPLITSHASPTTTHH